MILDRYGIFDGVSEVILLTWDGKINAAPIGIRRDGKKIWIEVFKNTRTYRNLRENRKIVANIVHEPEFFILSLSGKLQKKHFKIVDGIPTLKDSSSWILFSCRSIREGKEKAEVVLSPVKGKINFREVIPFRRARYALIEAAIALTRNQKEKLEYYRRIVERCGGRKEKKLMEMLESRI